jgi:hypothetical protein
LTEDQVIHLAVPPTVLDAEHKLPCACLVKGRGGEYRGCYKPPEFWMETPSGKVMVCFTHINANTVTLPK